MSEAILQTDYAAQFGRGLWRYVRARFGQAGQDSFTEPPGQSEDMFERLLNVMPPVQGDLDRRWGYRLFNLGLEVPGVQQPYPMYLYADDPFTFRRLISVGLQGFHILDEAGLTDALAYTSVTFGGRGVTSRGLFYWADTVKPIWFKTDALNNFQFGNWGISTAGIAANAVGPLPAGAVASFGTGPAWLSPANAPVDTTTGALSIIPNTQYINNGSQFFKVAVHTADLRNEVYGFTLPTDAVISGIEVSAFVNPPNQVTVGTFNVPADSTFGVQAALQKLDGTVVATKILTLSTSMTAGIVTFGGPGDLWGTTWNTADFNGGQFGVVLTQFLDWTVQPHTTVRAQQAIASFVAQTSGYAKVKLYGENLPVTAVGGTTGNVTLISGRQYAYSFVNSALSTYSDLSLFSNSTGPVTNLEIDLTNIPTSPDTQVDTVLIVATGDGGDETTLYEVGRVANGTASFTDDVPEETLLLANQWQASLIDGTDVGLADNQPPPQGLQFPTLHRGRMYGLVGNNLYYSKSEDELLTPTGVLAGRFEQCWPPLNFFPVTNLGETATGLLSDGTVLYIGTDRRVIRLFGDGPATFLQPESLFDNVGVLNQDCWKLVLLEGNPVGAMWLTPDYRVVGSDFNTYQDVGMPVQNVLDDIWKPGAVTATWASYVGISVFNLYVLALPTVANLPQPTLMLIFDIKGKKWYEWQLSDLPVGGFWWVSRDGVPQFIFLASNGKYYAFDENALQDRVNDTPQGFAAQIKTSWLGMGDQTARKNLNEIEVMTGDPDMLLTVEGASSVADFAAPRQVVLNAPLVTKPRGELGAFLAGASTRDRFYRFTFDSSSEATTDLLRSFNVQGRILHRV